jgi:hypothetical protein
VGLEDQVVSGKVTTNLLHLVQVADQDLITQVQVALAALVERLVPLGQVDQQAVMAVVHQ